MPGSPDIGRDGLASWRRIHHRRRLTEIYNGSVLAGRGDVVVVTISYRLGPLGLRLNDVTNGRIPIEHQQGLLDQLAALEWVRGNIAEFGGDPDNVSAPRPHRFARPKALRF